MQTYVTPRRRPDGRRKIMRATLVITAALVTAAIAAPVAGAERPDDRGGMRGPGAIASLQPGAARQPDSRARARPGELAVSQPTAIVRPDDRPGSRGPGVLASVVVAPRASTFDWSDALLGGLGGAGIALLLTGGIFVAASHRRGPRTA
jgi:hypothetical protein